MNTSGLPKAVEITMSNGQALWVWPLSYADKIRLDKVMRERYPFPNEKDFETPAPEGIALVPGQMLPGKENPEYRVEFLKVQSLRNDYYTDEILRICPDAPANTTKDELIKQYERVVGHKTRGLNEPDAWYKTVLYGIVQTQQDAQLIVDVAQESLELGMEEIADGVRLFRPLLKRRSGRGLPAADALPRGSDTETDDVNTQSPVQGDADDVEMERQTA